MAFTDRVTADINSKIASGLKDVKNKLNYEEASVIQLADSDVYRNYTWGINSPNQVYIEQVPKIILTEYQPNAGPLLEEIEYTIKTLEATTDTLRGNKVNPYITMYRGVLTGNVYQLPFFSTYNHTMSSTWDLPDNETLLSDIRKTIGKGAGIFQRGLVEKRRIWKGSTASTYSFSFNLYNTFNGEMNILKNFHFIRALVYNNLATRTSYATMLPPCFYKLEIPGVRYAPVAALDGIDIQNLGQINRRKVSIPIGGGFTGENVIEMNIPDAWGITISVSELHNESREIYDGVFNNSSKVNVIDAQDAIPGENINIQKIRGGSFL